MCAGLHSDIVQLRTKHFFIWAYYIAPVLLIHSPFVVIIRSNRNLNYSHITITLLLYCQTTFAYTHSSYGATVAFTGVLFPVSCRKEDSPFSSLVNEWKHCCHWFVTGLSCNFQFSSEPTSMSSLSEAQRSCISDVLHHVCFSSSVKFHWFFHQFFQFRLLVFLYWFPHWILISFLWFFF